MKEFEVVLNKLIKAESEIVRLKKIIEKINPNPKLKEQYNNIEDIARNNNYSNKDKVIMILDIKENMSTSEISKITNISKRSIQRYRKSIGKVYKQPLKPNESKILESKTYLMKNSRNGMYKIGKSINPSRREKTLQSEEPMIKIVKTWNYDIEKTLHKKYSKQRIRGEWFKLSYIQVKYICTNY